METNLADTKFDADDTLFYNVSFGNFIIGNRSIFKNENLYPFQSTASSMFCKNGASKIRWIIRQFFEITNTIL